MMWALYKLAWYEKGYLYAVWPTLVYTLVCFVNGILFTFSMDAGAVVEYITVCVRILSIVCCHTFILQATEKMCLRADLPKHAVKAKRNLIVTYIYCALDLLVMFFKGSLGTMSGYVAFAMLIVTVVWLFSNAFLLFRCFQLICEEGDEDAMPKRPTNAFAKIIDSMFEKIFRRKNEEESEEQLKKDSDGNFDAKE